MQYKLRAYNDQSWGNDSTDDPSRSCPKTKSGGRSTAPHFKVVLFGRDGTHKVSHKYLIKIDYQDGTGHARRYQTNSRTEN